MKKYFRRLMVGSMVLGSIMFGVTVDIGASPDTQQAELAIVCYDEALEINPKYERAVVDYTKGLVGLTAEAEGLK